MKGKQSWLMERDPVLESRCANKMQQDLYPPQPLLRGGEGVEKGVILWYCYVKTSSQVIVIY